MFLFSRHFVRSLDFTGMEVDEALRVYQTCFRLPVSVLYFCQSVFFPHWFLSRKFETRVF